MPRTRAMLDRASLEEAFLDRLQAEARRYRLSVGGERSELIDRVLSHIERMEAQEMIAETQSGPSNGPSVGGEATGGLEEPLTMGTLRSALNEMTDLMRQQQQSIHATVDCKSECVTGGRPRRCAVPQRRNGVGSFVSSNSESRDTTWKKYG